MSDWNEQSAPNNNLPPVTIGSSKLVGKKGLENDQVSNEMSHEVNQEDVLEQVRKKHPGVLK